MTNSMKSSPSGSRPRWINMGSGNRNKHSTSYHLNNFTRACRNWIIPYIKSCIFASQFRPVLSFLYTDLICNIVCHYCFIKDKSIPGMTMEVARDAVDWLHSTGCRVLAYMGGEPLVRKEFIIDLTRYATEKGLFVYLPTNGILLDKEFIDEIGRAGLATVNLAVDSVNGYAGLPKYFNRIKPQFEYLVEQEKKYGYITFLNINITRHNIKDVRELTKIAHEYGIATDYHINERPLIKYEPYKHEDEGGWITDKEFHDVDKLLDWLIGKNLQGYTMVNSLEHLRAMKLFIRDQLPPWSCYAGRLTMIIRLDGSFAPCFELYGEGDWGNIYDGPKFDPDRLAAQKQECNKRCLSTCNFQVNHYAQSGRHRLQWVSKHAYSHHFGIS